MKKSALTAELTVYSKIPDALKDRFIGYMAHESIAPVALCAAAAKVSFRTAKHLLRELRV